MKIYICVILYLCLDLRIFSRNFNPVKTHTCFTLLQVGSLPFFSSFSLVAFGKSVNVVTLDKSRVADALEPSSSELSEEVPLLVLSDLPRAPLLSAVESSLDDSGSAPAPPDDCCLRLRYSDMDNWKGK